uniref:Uncharacterized protein n=1 Tax=Anguilla anguilla TaxID=7936 RepID=A0A0E9SBL5_ANGAN
MPTNSRTGTACVSTSNTKNKNKNKIKKFILVFQADVQTDVMLHII